MNTCIRYKYRDASNYKFHGAVVLAGLLALFPALVAYRRALVDGLGVRL